ncbi:hypothetical protein HanIR_Chr17g0888981 [Helianthus annuus]|nr:hypothetical protein HanIR_Chr17g0888981 [Helianthus annuus]
MLQIKKQKFLAKKLKGKLHQTRLSSYFKKKKKPWHLTNNRNGLPLQNHTLPLFPFPHDKLQNALYRTVFRNPIPRLSLRQQ